MSHGHHGVSNHRQLDWLFRLTTKITPEPHIAGLLWGESTGGRWILHYDDVIMTMLASQITSLTVVYSIVYSGVNQRKHQSSALLAFVPHKWPVTRKMFPFDDVIMLNTSHKCGNCFPCPDIHHELIVPFPHIVTEPFKASSQSGCQILLRPRQNGHRLQTRFSPAFSSMITVVFNSNILFKTCHRTKPPLNQLIGNTDSVNRLVAWSVLSHYLNQCWIIVNWALVYMGFSRPQWFNQSLHAF